MNRTTQHFRIDQPITPWGPAHTATDYGQGVTFYTTAQHGGFHLSEEALARMAKPLDSLGTFAGPGWYEEDADWSLVAVSFPDLFDDYELFCAARILLARRPRYLEGAEAWLSTPEAKPIIARIDAFYAANKDLFEISGMHTAGEIWACRAYTLSKDRILIFEMKAYPPWAKPFTRADVEALGAVITADKRKEDVAA